MLKRFIKNKLAYDIGISFLIFFPFYLLFFCFPELFRYNLSEEIKILKPPPWNSYWIKDIKGIEALLLLFVSISYLLLVFRISSRIDIFRARESNKIMNSSIILSFFAFLTIWFASHIFSENHHYYSHYFHVFSFNILNLKDYYSVFFVFIYSGILFFYWKYDNVMISRLFIFAIIFVCALIPSQFPQQYDFEFVAYPTLGLIWNDPINHIYFQYDLLISFLLYLWVVIGFGVHDFYLAIHFVILLYLLGLYSLSKKLIEKTRIFYFFFFIAIFFRFYYLDMKFGSIYVQNSPIRLDLWLPMLILALNFGIRSIWLKLFLLLLIPLSFSVGIFLLLIYLITLFALRMVEHDGSLLKCLFGELYNNKLFLVISISTVIFCYTHMFNLGQTLSSIKFSSMSIFGEHIQKFSLIWLILPMIGFTSLRLLSYRDKISEKKFASILFLSFISVGSLFYYFWKGTILSLINVLTPTILLIFVIIDLIMKYDSKPIFSGKIIRYSKHGLFLSFILILVFFSSSSHGPGSIIKFQSNFIKNNYVFKSEKINLDYKTTNDIKLFIGEKEKIIFFGPGIYKYHYALNIKPDNYFMFSSNIYDEKNYATYLKTKLEEGYLIIFPKAKVTPWGIPDETYSVFWNELADQIKNIKIYNNTTFEAMERRNI